MRRAPLRPSPERGCYRIGGIGSCRREALSALWAVGDWGAGRAGAVGVYEGERFRWLHQLHLLAPERLDAFLLALPLAELLRDTPSPETIDALRLLRASGVRRGIIWAMQEEAPPLGHRFEASTRARALLYDAGLCAPHEEPLLLIGSPQDGAAALSLLDRLGALISRERPADAGVELLPELLLSSPLDSEREVEEGELLLASGRKLHLEHPLSVSQTLLTWGRLTAIGILPAEEDRPRGPDYPVSGVSCWTAALICNELSQAAGLAPTYLFGEDGRPRLDPSSSGYRLPSAREWLYCAFAGRVNLFAGGDEHDEVAWHLLNAGSRPHPVAQRRPNQWGLYDCTGLLWEWCFNPAATAGAPQPLCGGSWANRAPKLRLNQALMESPQRGDQLYGMRPVRQLSSP